MSSVMSVSRADISDLNDIVAMEREPYEKAVPFRSTAALLDYAAAAYGSLTAVHFQEDADPDGTYLTWSFEAFQQQCIRAAHLFRSLGVQREAPVALLVPHIPSSLFALWGAQMAGCAFPINYLLGAEHIAQLLRKTGTRVLVTLAPCASLPINAEAHRAAELAGCVEHVLEIDPNERNPRTGSFQAQLLKYPDRDSFQDELTPDSTAAFFHTGGTTGLPKILRHTHRNEVHTSWFAAFYYAMQPGDRVLNGFPLFHVAGTFVYGLGPLVAGVTLFLPTLTGLRNQDFIRHAWHFADKYGITHFGCVPTVLSALLGVPKAAQQAKNVRWALTGGSPLPTELAQRFESQCDISVRNIFGMTECAGIVSIEPCMAPRHPASVGVRLPYSEVVAVPLESASKSHLNEFCQPGETGIIAIRGPHVSSGYLDSAQAEGTFTQDNWLLSGDLGHVDKDGYIYLTGRSKDLIIRSGHNIDPGIIEEAFLKLSDVSTCAAVGEPDAYAGELPVVFVTLKEGASLPPDQLLELAAPHVPERPAVPKRVTILDTMPTTPIGKIYKPTLRAMAAQTKMIAVIQPLGLPDGIKVQCSAQTRGVVAEIAIPASFSDDQIARLKETVGSLPLQIDFIHC
ncbi:MAG: hypothetical protein CML16_03645 [Pusillimonas sp.]|nr:hypothetical protein [Pusillimonas sp.]MBC43682.1 hypothetical protein [Pusillimonas sp.]|tara:strand:+ start:37100 stop:38974 length:1875 start_codon:yes stop_codon:yes gene_type:complete